ncbi:MAG: hypothetical protein GWN00_08000 [Aliifodinibius sp.]|nr:hypothetical protein [candidate division Zixibacteria bacterium]NIT56168.1 hypothetical protein [Fodinibius sp.]NIV11169.1 hypothetical protein [Fodinibius sp.]NIY24751.1 hypothetical protein [Fodinibius sp.]
MSQLLTFQYDENISPAVPVVEIELDGYGNAAPIRLTAIVDSGADCTMIPHDLLEAIDATYQDSMRMRGVVGDFQLVDRFLVRVTIGNYVIPAIYAISHEDEALIGRDVLNELWVTLNGPAYVIEIQLD